MRRSVETVAIRFWRQAHRKRKIQINNLKIINIMAKPLWISVSKSNGTGNDSVDVTAQAYTGREQRSGVITANATGGGSDTSTVEQAGKPEFIQLLTEELTVTADKSGQVLSFTGKSNCADLKVVQSVNEDLAQIEGVSYALEVNGEADGNWNNATTSVDGDPGASAEYDFTLKITIPANKTESSKGGLFVIRNANSSVSSGQITVTQDAGVKNYALPVIIEFKYANKIPASGGSVTPTLSYKQTWGWNNSTTDGGTLSGTLVEPISGSTFVFDGATDSATGKVTAPSKGTTVSEETKVADVTAKVTVNGKTSAVFTAQAVNQAANVISYGEIEWAERVPSIQDIPASGGKSGSVVWSGEGVICRQTISWSSGSSVEITNENGSESPVFEKITISYGPEVSAESKGTVQSGRTEAGTVAVTATGAGDQTAEKTVSVMQGANTATYGEVTINEDAVISLSAEGQTYQIDADARQTVTYTSGASRTEASEASPVEIGVDYAVKTPKEGFTLDDLLGEVTVVANPSASVRGGFVVSITAEGEGGKTASKDITFNQQSADSTITLTPPTLSFSAAGETKELTVASNDSWILV